MHISPRSLESMVTTERDQSMSLVEAQSWSQLYERQGTRLAELRTSIDHLPQKFLRAKIALSKLRSSA